MPLLFDMPLEQLSDYTGTNPRPDDFAGFWDRGLKEMRSLEPRVELTPSKFQTPYADCSDLYFTGTGGAWVHAQLLRPKDVARPGPAVLMFHGYSANAGDWSEKLGYVAMGYTVAAMDCRGQGGQSQDAGGVVGNTLRGHIIRGLDGPPDNMLYRHIFLDTALLARIVMDMPHVDENRVGATGASQGGGLTLACAALEPRIKRAAPTYPFLSDYRRVWDIDQARAAYQELQDYFRHYDPLHERNEETFTKLGYIDVQYLAPRIRAEILMSVGLMDTVCPPSTQFAAYNKITSEKHLAIYPDFAHEDLPGNQDRIMQFLMAL